MGEGRGLGVPAKASSCKGLGVDMMPKCNMRFFVCEVWRRIDCFFIHFIFVFLKYLVLHQVGKKGGGAMIAISSSPLRRVTSRARLASLPQHKNQFLPRDFYMSAFCFLCALQLTIVFFCFLSPPIHYTATRYLKPPFSDSVPSCVCFLQFCGARNTVSSLPRKLKPGRFLDHNLIDI
ncbi:hypothetical protein K440DRAFT_157186 [Wilcoxina mikolae CBS 423.85]|nr:hypothetical protein K440DRAFT_157186 [Wilcoxina mikolae CBS 423.85]